MKPTQYRVVASSHDTDRSLFLDLIRNSRAEAEGTVKLARESGYRYTQIMGQELYNGYPVDISNGHIRFVDGFEFFERDGNVYRAPISACVMPDGFRSGRWESTKTGWDARHSFLNPA